VLYAVLKWVVTNAICNETLRATRFPSADSFSLRIFADFMEKTVKSTHLNMPPVTFFLKQKRILFFLFFLVQFTQFVAQVPAQPAIDSLLVRIPSRVMTIQQIELIAGRNGGNFATRRPISVSEVGILSKALFLLMASK
jgi:hypothetical protein